MPLTSIELQLLKDVVSLPTAPFCEWNVQEYVRAWAKRNGVGFEQDGSGNILLSQMGKGRQTGKPWVLQAHMDHPGFSFIKRRGSIAWAWFRGGVQQSYFEGSRMRFFPAAGNPVFGTVLSAKRDKEAGFLRCRIQLEESVDLPEGTLGMWDLAPWRRSGDSLSLRVADDLCGVASILLAMQRLKQAGSPRKVYGLLTRAEEVGFVGAISAAKNKLVDPAWPVLGIEASKAQPNARLGQGAVVRVGDASTVFDPELTALLRKTSRELVQSGQCLSYVESLMPGGSTESTGLALMGYRTCAVCLPLGNYHNMGKTKIAPERINLRDFESLVALLVEVSQHVPDASHSKALKHRLLENHKKCAPLL